METIWTWLNGKKTLIGAVAANVVPWLYAFGVLNDAGFVQTAAAINAFTGKKQ
jgi:hypothetical protein